MKRLIILAILAFLAYSLPAEAQTDMTRPGDPVVGGQLIQGIFVPATVGTPAGNANMYPSDAPPSNAIDNGTSTKYRNFGETDTGLIITPRLGETFIFQLILTTANDSPERDPLTFTLEGTTGDPLTGAYALIGSGSTGLEADPGRSTSVLAQTFPSPSAYTSYRLIFPTVRDSATADSMQIAEIQLRGVTVPEPTILSLLGLSAIGLMGVRRKRRVTA